MKFRLEVILALLLLAGIYLKWPDAGFAADQVIDSPKSISERVQQYGSLVAERLKPDFDKASVAYPPTEITLVILKQERRLDIYARDSNGFRLEAYHYIRSYPILAASGHLGPKLHEGDEQVPEGIYAVESLNPNSLYHLSLHVDYPNAFDRAQAKAEGRTQLGGDIMIHGNQVSIGCVAMGDPAAEDLFILAAKVGIKNVKLLFCPYDFRVTKSAPPETDLPAWTPKLYAGLKPALGPLPLPTAQSGKNP